MNGVPGESDMKKKIIIFTLIIVLVMISIIGIVIYQNENKAILQGYYYSEFKSNTYGYLIINDNNTFDYRIDSASSVAIHGEYMVNDNYLLLDSNHGMYKFEIQYKKLKFIEGDFMPFDIVECGDIYKWSTERKYTADYKREQKIESFIKDMLIVFVLVAVVGVGEVIYKRNRRRLLSGFYNNKKRTEYIEIKEDGTYSYVITAEGLQVCGRYSVDKHCLILISEDSNVYKFEILYKGLKFIECDGMTDRRVKKNERYRWSAERK